MINLAIMIDYYRSWQILVINKTLRSYKESHTDRISGRNCSQLYQEVERRVTDISIRWILDKAHKIIDGN